MGPLKCTYLSTLAQVNAIPSKLKNSMLKSFCVDLQHGLQTSGGGFWAYPPQVLGGKGQYFHLVTRPPPIFSNFAGKTVTRLGLALRNRGEKPAIGQFLRGSLPWLTNNRDTKREKMTSVCFGLPWSEKCKQNHAWFWTEWGYKLKTKKCKPFRGRKIWNSEQW